MRARTRDERGFTLVEMLICIILLALITGALSAAFVTSLHASAATTANVEQSNDAQVIAAFLTRDAEAAGSVDPGTNQANPNLGVVSSLLPTSADSGACPPESPAAGEPAGTSFFEFSWIDQSADVTHYADYSYDVTSQHLVRTICDSTGSSSSLTLAEDIVSNPNPVCTPGCLATPTIPATVFLTLTEAATPQVPQYTFTLTATVRPQAGGANTAIPTPLVILAGRTACGSSDGTTGLGVLLGTLHVYGRTYINAHDSACAAMNLVIGASYQSGVTSLVTGASCDTFFSAPCPSAPFLTKNNPPINDPYANLPPLDPAALGLASGKTSCASGPGIYANLLSITGSCTLSPGIYVLHNGISISNGASLTGNGVLLYIDHGGFDANGAGSINLTGLAGNTPATAPYAGLAIWKTDSSTVSCDGFFTSSAAGVCFEGSFFSSANINGAIYAPQSSVANQLAILANSSVKAIVAQALIVSEGLGGTMSVGTPSATQPNITTTSLPPWTVNQPYPATTVAASGGTPPYWWTATNLPPGLSIDGASGTISGTPTSSGNYNATVSVTDILGESDSQNFSISISAAPAITNSPPDWTVSFDYRNFKMLASGGTTPFTWQATGLPTGLSINSVSGVISGSPTTVGSYNTSITVTDKTGASDTNLYTVHINSLPSISGPASLPSPWTQNSAYPSTQIVTANGTAPFTWAASGLPPGLSINSSGQVVGTPTAAGNFNSVTVTGTDAAGAAATKTYAIQINGPLGLSGSLPTGEISRPYSYTIVPTGGTAPYTFSISGGALPAGLTLSTGGTIAGTPTAVGSPSVTIRVRDATNATTTRNYTLTIVAAPNITTNSLPNWTINRDYKGTQIQSTGGVGSNTFVVTTGTLPPGLAVSGGGLVTGTPTTTGTYSFSVTLTDGAGGQDTQAYTVTINGPPSITTVSLPGGETSLAYNASMAASGGTTPYTWSANGMPPGLSLSSGGAFSGSPTASGVFSVNITVNDNAGASASQTFSINIVQGPGNGTSTLPNGEVGITYPPTAISATGGTGSYTFSATGMPGGLSINNTTGVVSGTPTASGTFTTVKITITDSAGGTSVTTYTIVVAKAPSVATTSLPAGAVGLPYGATLNGQDGTQPYSAWTASGLPAGLSIDSNTGIISGTPTSTGVSTVIVSMKDSLGATAPNKTLSLTVNPAATVTGINPTSRGQGFSGTVTITGTNFLSGGSLKALFSNPGITVNSTARTNSTTLTINITIANNAATGAGLVTVINGDGNAATGTATFTVNAGPTITNINPNSKAHGTSNVTVIITGTGFVSGSTITFTNGSNAPSITTTFNSGTQLTIKFNLGFTRTNWDVVVTNPDGGTFTVPNGFTAT